MTSSFQPAYAAQTNLSNGRRAYLKFEVNGLMCLIP
jgi:hypothetical protein